MIVAALALGCASKDGQEQTQLARPDGARRLTTPVGNESDQNPCVSPDGTFVVFTRFARGYNRGPAQIMRLDLAPGAGPVALTSGDFDHVNVPWGCFDGSTGRVVFAADREESNDLWTVNPDPDDPDLRRLTDHGELPVWIEPVYSPDGRFVAFEQDVSPADEESQRARIVRLDLVTGAVTTLTNTAGDVDDRLPSWSADGARILFQHRDPSVAGSLERWEAWTMDPDGGDQVNVSALEVVARRGPDTDLSWMPDDAYILASTNPDGTEHPSIFMIPVAGGTPIGVTDTGDTREDGAPCASPDGRSVYFESHRTADEDSPTDLWVVSTPSM